MKPDSKAVLERAHNAACADCETRSDGYRCAYRRNADAALRVVLDTLDSLTHEEAVKLIVGLKDELAALDDESPDV